MVDNMIYSLNFAIGKKEGGGKKYFILENEIELE